MEILLITLIGVLVGVGCYLMLDGRLLRIVLGLSIFSHSINLMFFISSKAQSERPPLIGKTEKVLTGVTADSLPQALILTAIVIGFAMIAFFVVLSQRILSYYGTDNVSHLTESDQ